MAEVATPSRAVSAEWRRCPACEAFVYQDRKSTRLNSSHLVISYAVFCLKKKTTRLIRRFQLVRPTLTEGAIRSLNHRGTADLPSRRDRDLLTRLSNVQQIDDAFVHIRHH